MTFRLRELAVVLTMIGIVLLCAGFVTSRVYNVQIAAWRTSDVGSLKHLVMGISGYHDAHKRYPPARGGENNQPCLAACSG